MLSEDAISDPGDDEAPAEHPSRNRRPPDVIGEPRVHNVQHQVHPTVLF